jgi:Fe-S cluster assembly iron-binding protein IscA
MNCKITRNAAKVIQRELASEADGRKLRVFVSHLHGDHAHYGLRFDEPQETDEIVMTDKGIEVLLDRNDPWLDGVKIDYLYFPEEGFVITNPSRGHHGRH